MLSSDSNPSIFHSGLWSAWIHRPLQYIQHSPILIMSLVQTLFQFSMGKSNFKIAILRRNIHQKSVFMNTLFWCMFLLSIAILKLLLPIENWKRVCTKLIINIGECWIYCNGLWIQALHKPEWKIEGFESLDNTRWYLSVANHQS